MLPSLLWIPQRHCHVCGDLNVHPQNGRKQVKIDRLIDSKNGWIHQVPHLFGTCVPSVGWKTYRNCRLAAVFLYFTCFQPSICKFSLYIFWTSSAPYGRSKRLHLFYKKASIEICLGFSQSIAMFQVPLMPWCDVGFFVGHVEHEKQTSTLQKLTESRKTRNFIFKSALGGEYAGS